LNCGPAFSCCRKDTGLGGRHLVSHSSSFTSWLYVGVDVYRNRLCFISHLKNADSRSVDLTEVLRLPRESLLRTDPVPEEGEDVAATISTTETLSEEEQEELRRELAKVEEEIQTLSQVLAAKEKHLAEIKRKLGINSLQELKQNLAKGWQDVTATSAYKKTSETLSQAGQKASAAFSSVGSVITKKLEDVKNSPTFKSFEEKVENLKSKVGGTKPAGGDFGEVLNSTANASATATEPLPEQTQETL
uniref:Tumor protein D52 n=1 Tax=Equus caballus TaxID=9796 RepID=A0A9L0RBM9_HORSE